MYTQTIYLLIFGLPALYLFRLRLLSFFSPSTTTLNEANQPLTTSTTTPEPKPKNIMQPTRDDLLPPKNDPFTLEELRQYDGSDPTKPIYVSIKGTVFDVSLKRDIYGPTKAYNVFAGKDGSRGLGMSSLKPEDAVPDYTGLSDSDMKVLNDWHGFFSKRYNVVGRVSDHPVPMQLPGENLAPNSSL